MKLCDGEIFLLCNRILFKDCLLLLLVFLSDVYLLKKVLQHYEYFTDTVAYKTLIHAFHAKFIHTNNIYISVYKVMNSNLKIRKS